MSEIEQAEKAVKEQIKSLQKVRDRLTRARKQVQSGKQMTLALSSLAEDLRTLPPEPAIPDWGELADCVAEEARKQTEHGDRLFQQEINALAEPAGLNVGRSGDAMTVGPFQLLVDWKRGFASLHFSKTEVEKGLPLMPKDLLTRIVELSKSLLSPPPSGTLADLAKEVEEAIRVCIARRGGSLAGDLRAELPAVYRELGFIKHGKEGGGGRRSAPYPLVRFIVEIKSLVQSEFNATRSRRFRLETAVIENTKNPRKSVFIASDLTKGFGEGTYFQAILLTAGA
jgi:hypothetical protein